MWHGLNHGNKYKTFSKVWNTVFKINDQAYRHAIPTGSDILASVAVFCTSLIAVITDREAYREQTSFDCRPPVSLT